MFDYDYTPKMPEMAKKLGDVRISWSVATLFFVAMSVAMSMYIYSLSLNTVQENSVSPELTLEKASKKASKMGSEAYKVSVSDKSLTSLIAIGEGVNRKYISTSYAF